MIVKSGQSGRDVCAMAGLTPRQWPDVFDAMVEIIAGPQAPDPIAAPVDWGAKFAEMARRQ